MPFFFFNGIEMGGKTVGLEGELENEGEKREKQRESQRKRDNEKGSERVFASEYIRGLEGESRRKMHIFKREGRIDSKRMRERNPVWKQETYIGHKLECVVIVVCTTSETWVDSFQSGTSYCTQLTLDRSSYVDYNMNCVLSLFYLIQKST